MFLFEKIKLFSYNISQMLFIDSFNYLCLKTLTFIVINLPFSMRDTILPLTFIRNTAISIVDSAFSIFQSILILSFISNFWFIFIDTFSMLFSMIKLSFIISFNLAQYSYFKKIKYLCHGIILFHQKARCIHIKNHHCRKLYPILIHHSFLYHFNIAL